MANITPHRQIVCEINEIAKGEILPDGAWATVVTDRLISVFKESLSPAERENIENIENLCRSMDLLCRCIALLPESQLMKLDYEILYQAETLGCKLEASPLVRQCRRRWDELPNGPYLHKTYGEACAKSVLYKQGKAPLPLDHPEFYKLKADSVDQLRLLEGRMWVFDETKRGNWSKKEVLDEFFKIVSDGDGPALYPDIFNNRTSWLKFLDAEYDTWSPTLLGKEKGPGALFDAWLAWTSGASDESRWEPEVARQKISLLGKAKGAS
jgi:hypothetical protein